MSFLSLKKTWINDDQASDALAATFARLQIFLGRQNITEFKTGRKLETKLEIPVYYLAEWLAENWWVTLFEPRKDEENEDPGFIARHSILSAQHGFPLPALTLIPFGRSIRLNCSPRKAVFADTQFRVDAFGDESTEAIQATLTDFLDEVDKRLQSAGINDTSFQAAWRDVKGLSLEERNFCELVGSLGIAPDQISDDISNAIEKLFGVLGPQAIRDFCLAITPKEMVSAAANAEELKIKLRELPDIKIDALLKAELPSENLKAPSWRRGMAAAKNLRDKLKIDVRDEGGPTKIFDMLNIDLKLDCGIRRNDDIHFSGAVDRQGTMAKIALLPENAAQRRFAAGRATYLTWVSGDNATRLMTNALTRDQQASRQFAAEILVPQAYLKALAQPRGALSYDHVIEIAHARGAMPDVAFKQAYNAGIQVASI